ncbi:hypothetical protein J1605_007294, partial [Eschrichtius robustus]
VASTINAKQEYCPIGGCIKEDSFMEKLQPKKYVPCALILVFKVQYETETGEEIDEALKVAAQNFEQLSIAVKVFVLCSSQMLEHIYNQTKEETVSLIEVLEKQFDQLFTSLDSR